MRRLVQPGPEQSPRIVAVAALGAGVSFSLQPGRSLNEALTGPMRAAGLRSGQMEFSGCLLGPFHYVIPAVAPDAGHVAYFSATRSPPGWVRVEHACATFGWRDGAPFVHCHAVWTDAAGNRACGHVLPRETMVAAPAAVRGWGFADTEIRAEPDPETNFPLFAPVRIPEPAPPGPRLITGGVAPPAPVVAPPARRPGQPVPTQRMISARVRPNVEIHEALRDICRTYRAPAVRLRGSLGSLVCPRFSDGRVVDSIATEVLVLAGTATPDAAELRVALVGMDGVPHEGILAHGENPVCITFELLFQPVG